MRLLKLARVGGSLLALGLTFCSSVLAQPVASPASITAQVNTPASLNLAPFITGAGITGIAISASPSNGTATVSGTTVTYTPANNYFGPDSFSYVAFGAGGMSAPAAVTVAVTGQPDPASSGPVVGLLAAQFDAARRFSTAQISNYQRRLESLHARPAGGGASNTRARSGSPGRLTANAGTHGELFPAHGSFPVLADATPMQSINLAAMAGDKSASSTPAGRGAPDFWIDGIINFGNREPGANRGGLDFTTQGVSLGVDRRLNDQLAVGVGLGFAKDTTFVGFDGTQSRSRGLSIATYGSYQLSDKVFVDGLVGIGSLDIDTQRFVAPANAFAASNRDGYQMFASLSAGYEYRNGGTLISPYARLDLFADRLDRTTETGAGQQALTYYDQKAQSAQGVLGLRAEAIHATRFGWVVPRIRAEYRHDFQGGDRQATVGYAGLPGGPILGVPVEVFDRDVFVLGIGNDFVRRDGLTIGFDYQLTEAFSGDTNHMVRFRLAKDLDARGPASLGNVSLPHSPPLNIQVDAGYTYDDNVTRSRTPGEILSDHAYSINVGKVEIVPVAGNARILMNFFAGGDQFQNYDGLSRVFAGFRGELQYRASAEWGKPTLAAFLRLAGEQYESALRKGSRLSGGFSVRQPVTDRIDLFGAIAHNERRAKSDVFNTRDNSARFNLDYQLGPRETLYLSGEFRRGDIVSTGSASLENLSIAEVFVADDAFPGKQFFTYRFDANTVLATLGYNYRLGSRDSLDLSWRRVESTPHERWAFSTSPSSYVVNQFSISYLVRF